MLSKKCNKRSINHIFFYLETRNFSPRSITETALRRLKKKKKSSFVKIDKSLTFWLYDLEC